MLCVRRPGPLGSCSPVCTLRVWCFVCGVLGRLAPVHRCACPGLLCRMHGVLGLLAPVHRCAHCVCGVVGAAPWATWLLFTSVRARCILVFVPCSGPLGLLFSGVHALCAVLCVWSPRPFGSCFLVCSCGLCCVACLVSWDTCFVLSGVFSLCVAVCCGVCGVRGAVLRVWCSGPPSPCSPVRMPGVWCCVGGVLVLLAPGQRRACFACGVVRARCPGPLGSCSPVCFCGVLCGVCGILGHLAPVHRCACVVCCVVGTVAWAAWLLFTGVHARCAVFCAWCPGHLGSWSPVCFCGVLCGVCGVPGHLAPVQRCACVVCCVVGTVSWAAWLLFTGVHARCAVFFACCPGPLGSCSPVCFCGVLCGVCGVLGHLAPVHRCARSVCYVLCLVSWASWLLFTGVFVWCVMWCMRRPGPPGSCSPVCLCGALCGVHGVLGLVAPVHRCARSVCVVLCVVSWATWLLFTGVLLWCFVRCVRCPGPLGSCSPVCGPGVRCFVFGVLGLLAPVHRCPCVVCCVVCAVSWTTWLLFTGVPAWRVLCCVCGVLGLVASVHWCAMCLFCVLCAVCSVPGHVAPVHQCACSVWCVVCVV